jgi:hypothetical protein
VARPRTLANVRRDEQIYALWIHTQDPASVAEKFKITPRRVLQIVAARNPEIEEDIDRAVHRGRLEVLYEQVQDILNSPGFKLAPNGRFAKDEDGDPVLDVGAKIEAAKVQLAVLESMRRLNATDKPAVKKFQLERSEAEHRMWLEVEQERRRMTEAGKVPAAVRGEVIRELPA